MCFPWPALEVGTSPYQAVFSLGENKEKGSGGWGQAKLLSRVPRSFSIPLPLPLFPPHPGIYFSLKRNDDDIS